MEFLLCFLFPFFFFVFSARQCLSVFVSSLPAFFRDGRSFPVRFPPAHLLVLPSSKQWQKSSTCWEDLQPYFCQRKNADECSFVIFISIPITAFFSLFYLATFQCMLCLCDRYSYLLTFVCHLSFFLRFVVEVDFLLIYRAFSLRFFVFCFVFNPKP